MCNKTIHQTSKVTRCLQEDSFIASRTFDFIVLEHSNFLNLNLRFLISTWLKLTMTAISKPQGDLRDMPGFPSQFHTYHNLSHREISTANLKTTTNEDEFMIFINKYISDPGCDPADLFAPSENKPVFDQCLRHLGCLSFVSWD
ncbi:uncharacterized protein EAE97_003853 [Botrytis byssoidea]|uniref:Uncharacterized protein n=1 Tax=Botrytis byssoidea TaxID=139641 RepID=A0A9P5INT6_9HELO|nr:uncharacterized protein EAE97_003853 [Botrytis byssoidea]KAF7948442.1 hypothetical protein EAE97_003853 [Botrytis byssoidea]